MKLSEQWRITIFTVLGMLIASYIGGYLSGLGANNAISQQLNASNEQKLLEQQNIAHALYHDVSIIELYLDNSLNNTVYDMRRQHDIGYAPCYIHPYNNNWLYPIFAKDIASLNNTTSEDIYNFYAEVAEIENMREFIFTVKEKDLHRENVTLYERILSHEYANSTYTIMLNDSILQAEKVKRDLELNYHVNIKSVLMPSNNPNPKKYGISPGTNMILT